MNESRLPFVTIFRLGVIIAALICVSCAPAPAAAPTVPEKAAPVEVAAATSTTAPTQAVVNTVEPMAATATTAATAASSEAQSTEVPVTGAQATETPAASAGTPTVEATVAQAQTGLSAWCLPANSSVSNAKDPLNPPTNAKKAKVTANGIELSGLPSNGCMFLYTSGKGSAAGLKLELYEPNQPKPFLTTDLKQIEEKPEVAWTFLRHMVFTSPPAANIPLTFVVRDPLGQEVQRVEANLHSWVPGTPAPKEDEDCGCEVTVP